MNIYFDFPKNWIKKLRTFFMCMITSFIIFFPYTKKILLTVIGNFLSKVIGKSFPLFFINFLKLKILGAIILVSLFLALFFIQDQALCSIKSSNKICYEKARLVLNFKLLLLITVRIGFELTVHLTVYSFSECLYFTED